LIALLLPAGMKAMAALHATKPALQHVPHVLSRSCRPNSTFCGTCLKYMSGCPATVLHVDQHCRRCGLAVPAAAARASADFQSLKAEHQLVT
jgi:hypothetical protein